MWTVRSAILVGALTLSACDDVTGPPAFEREPRLVFVSARDGNNEIYSMNADGTGVVRLTNDAASDGRPVWSPNGSHIAFTSERDGNREIYIMNANGTGLRNLTLNA